MKTKGIILIFLVLTIVYGNQASLAKDVTIIPSVGLTGGYDDNIFFSDTTEVDDYYAVIKPAVNVDYKTDRGALGSNIALSYYNYAENDEIDRWNIRGNVDGKYKLKERWNIQGFFNVIKDDTLQSQLAETGRVSFRQERLRWDTGAGLDYTQTERSTLGLRYRYSNVQYENTTTSNYDVHQVSLPFQYRLKTQVDNLSLTPSYQHLDSDTSTVDNFRIQIGWTHRFSPTFDTRLQIGPRFTHEDFKNIDATDDTTGVVVDFKVTRRNELSSTAFSYNRGLRRATDGRLLEVDRFQLNYNHRFAHRFGVGLIGRIVFNRDVIALFGGDEVFFDVRPSLFYNLTEYHVLRLQYGYQLNNDRNTDTSRERNRITLNLVFNFPRKF